jgi:hypothetical protein
MHDFQCNKFQANMQTSRKFVYQQLTKLKSLLNLVLQNCVTVNLSTHNPINFPADNFLPFEQNVYKRSAKKWKICNFCSYKHAASGRQNKLHQPPWEVHTYSKPVWPILR